MRKAWTVMAAGEGILETAACTTTKIRGEPQDRTYGLGVQALACSPYTTCTGGRHAHGSFETPT
jgi:hypothetical protein